MTFRGNVPAQDRGFYFDPSTEDDTLSGETIENPKQTIQAAIDIAAALVPPLSITATAQVSAAQGASVTGSFVLEDFIQFDGEGILLFSDATIAVTLASTLAFELTGVFNDKLNGICFKIASENSLSARNGTLRVFGTDGVGYEVTGTCDDLFLTANQVILAGERAIGFKVTASSPTPIDIGSDTIAMDGDNTVFIDWGTPTLNDVGAVDISSVTATGTGTEIFTVRSGRLEVQAITLQADQIVTVKNTAEFSLSAHTLVGDTLVETGGVANYKAIGRITGDIVVETGATLDILCLEHIGTITNNGTINGRIGGQLFGTWAISGSFAHFFQENNLLTTDIITQNVFEDINCSLTGERLNGFTVSGNVITYTGAAAIDVEISLAANGVDTGNKKDAVLLAVARNGTKLSGRGRSRVETSGGMQSLLQTLTLFTTTPLVQNDTLELIVANGSDDVDIDIKDISGTVRQI